MNGPQATTKDDRAVSLANQKELREEVSRGWTGWSPNSREHVERTDANSVLSVSLQLAKQIKEPSKG